ncbi:M23 family metallopeptidase [Verrucosispora sp. WMMD703]|uniref:M23 family metallopeptidase n=1 Tax=Verrucosispora sp. WMMD703 TaxID=3403463 RepID=UPI003B958AE9
MSRRLATILLAVSLAVIFTCLAGTSVLVGTPAIGCAPGPATSLPPAPAAGWPTIGRWDRDQVSNAATITAVGARDGVPARGWVIAVATAMQESSLRNLPGGDRESIGLFQQRPSQGWGTPQQLLDPAHAAATFYATLLTVPHWQSMPLTEAAQRVQISAHPNAYAKWEPDATLLVTTITGGNLPSDGSPAAENCDVTGPWTQPIHAPVGSGFRTAARPGHDGVDLAAPRGTIIRAASTGTVTRVRCNAIDRRDGSNWGCHRDGNPNHTTGCGWYVDILHDQGIMTRYCHMDKPPLVQPGQPVTVGQPIGLVGSTGHSSGPHLHYEIHTNGDSSSAGAQDTVPWVCGSKGVSGLTCRALCLVRRVP